MENLPLVLFTILITVLVLCLTYLAAKLVKLRPSPPPPPRPEPPRDPDQGQTFEVNVEIGENNKWKVVNPDGSAGPLFVRKGDRINWKIAATDAFFQFPRSDHFYVDPRMTKGAKQIDPWTFEIGPDGGQISVLVAQNACPGSYTYGVFCNVAKKDNFPVTGFAEGGSPPEFIIMV